MQLPDSVSITVMAQALGIDLADLELVDAELSSMLAGFGLPIGGEDGSLFTHLGDTGFDLGSSGLDQMYFKITGNRFTRKMAVRAIAAQMSKDGPVAAAFQRMVGKLVVSPLTPDVPREWDSVEEMIDVSFLPILDEFFKSQNSIIEGEYSEEELLQLIS